MEETTLNTSSVWIEPIQTNNLGRDFRFLLIQDPFSSALLTGTFVNQWKQNKKQWKLRKYKSWKQRNWKQRKSEEARNTWKSNLRTQVKLNSSCGTVGISPNPLAWHILCAVENFLKLLVFFDLYVY